MKVTVTDTTIIVHYPEDSLPDQSVPRPEMYKTDQECLFWVRMAYGCERCGGGGNTREVHDDKIVARSCESCGGRRVMI